MNPKQNTLEVGWLTTYAAMQRDWKAMQEAVNVAVSRKAKVTMKAARVQKLAISGTGVSAPK